MRAYERFVTYARIHTASSEDFVKNPSTERQFDLARLLVKELKDLGVQDARLTDTCYVYGSLPATPGYEDKPKLGFIAHMDTIPDFSGENVKPTFVYLRLRLRRRRHPPGRLRPGPVPQKLPQPP